ncbi:hypothetical protein [Robertmurraya siralis]|uniref:hypothetical protein n=1 Tax=Robertmurraya siralis TaxID=77777 RepID=UPI0010F5325D|nr:hypothetical protein [Robertmurraya siralis]
MTKIEIKGELITNEELTDQDLVIKFMKALRTENLMFNGASKPIEDIKIYEKIHRESGSEQYNV